MCLSGRTFFRGSYWASYSLTRNMAGIAPPLSFAMNRVGGRRYRVNRAMLKLLWWLVKNIILLPFLPIRWAWKQTSREYYKELTKHTESGEPLSISRKVSGFDHFVRTVIGSLVLYILIFVIVVAARDIVGR